MKKRKGVALVAVLITFTLTSFFSLIMISYFRNNVSMSVQQQHLTRAYYYTQAGIELATAALYTTRINPAFDPTQPIDPILNPGPENFTLFEDFNNDDALEVPHLAPLYALRDEIPFYQTPNDATTPIVAMVTIDITRVDMRVVGAANPVWWVEVDVSTDLFDSAGALIVPDYRGTVRFLAENPAINERTR